MVKLSYHSFTKGHLVNKQINQSGFAHLVIVIVLAIGLLGALGFIYWQNFMKPKDSVSKVETVTKTDAANKTESQIPVVDSNKGYLVLDDWSVKFKLPTDLVNNTIEYQKYTNRNDVYNFSTSRVEAISASCVTSDDVYMGSIYRTSSSSYSWPSVFIKEINGLKYYYNSEPPTCSDKSADIQQQDMDAIKTMLLSISEK